jgi:microcompartment protein CcmL/EutN
MMKAIQRAAFREAAVRRGHLAIMVAGDVRPVTVAVEADAAAAGRAPTIPRPHDEVQDILERPR